MSRFSRFNHLVVALVAVSSLAACTPPGGVGGGSPASADGCGECTKQLRVVRKQIEALPDVARLITLETYTDSPTNGAGVHVELRTRSTGDPQVMDQVAEIIWKSDLAPVEEVFVAALDASGELVRGGGSPYDFAESSSEYDAYVAQWGARPVG